MLEAAWYLLARNYVISQDDFEDLLLRSTTQKSGYRKRLHECLQRVVLDACDRVKALVESAEAN